MKQIVTLVAILVLTSLSAIANDGCLRWLETSHNFGAFQEQMGLTSCRFQAVNEGADSVSVLQARATCGCTKPTYTSGAIAPGDTLTVNVSYDPSGRPGKFSKQVRVETNEGKYSLTIKGTVIGAPATLATRYPIEVGQMRISNSMTPFGQALKGRVLSAVVNIYNPTDHDVIPDVDSLPRYVRASFRPEVIRPGEMGTLSLTAYTEECDDYGVITDSFVIIPDSRTAPHDRMAVATTIIVNEDFSQLTPEQRERGACATLSVGNALDFGNLTAADGIKEKTVTITNTGKSPLIIRRYFTADEAVTLHLNKNKIKPGKSAKLKVTVDCSKLHAPDPLKARITIISNSPSAPAQVFRAVAEVK